MKRQQRLHLCETPGTCTRVLSHRGVTCGTGMYREGCGLSHVHMSWSAAEYLYLVLALNGTRLPPAALFLIRHQKVSPCAHDSDP